MLFISYNKLLIVMKISRLVKGRLPVSCRKLLIVMKISKLVKDGCQYLVVNC